MIIDLLIILYPISFKDVQGELCEDKFLLMKIDNAIGISEARAIVRNIKLYESEEGYEPTPSMNTWFACMKMPATAGPTEPPTKVKRTVMPRDIPLNFLGVDCRTISNPPTCINDNPPAITAKFVATKLPFEWNMSRLEKPTALTILPIMVGFTLPSLETIKPEDGANNRNTIINGSWIFAVVMTLSPNPNGWGLLTSTGIVWKTVNIDRKAITRMILAERMVLLVSNWKLTNGDLDLLSTITNSTNEVIPMNKNIPIW